MRQRLALANTVRLAAVVLVAVASFGFGKIERPTPYDPILQGPPPGPCNPQLGGADVVAGTDANGHPVVPADLPNRTNTAAPQVPQLWVKTNKPKGTTAYVDVAGIQPPQNCNAAPPPSR
jgi:hypothetical protein